MDDKSASSIKVRSSAATHRRVQRSTTLNRKYVKRPAKAATITSVAKINAENLARRQALAEKINRERMAALKQNRTASTTSNKATVASTPVAKPTASTPTQSTSAQLKDEAIRKALSSVATMEKQDAKISPTPIKANRGFGAKKIALALACAALCVGVIGYVVSLNMPDISIRAAAMQSGIDATYPSYIPRGYSLDNILSDNDKIVMTFSNSDGQSFSISEERSSWDSATLESNYVRPTWQSDYKTVRENGITIYIYGSNATWVNGGLVYKLEANSNVLTKKQIKSIAASL